jgi:hypothetical protein
VRGARAFERHGLEDGGEGVQDRVEADGLVPRVKAVLAALLPRRAVALPARGIGRGAARRVAVLHVLGALRRRRRLDLGQRGVRAGEALQGLDLELDQPAAASAHATLRRGHGTAREAEG